SAQGLLGVTRDPLVTLGQGDEFVAADDILDRYERLVAGALEHLAQDRVRRIGAAGQHDADGRLQALLLWIALSRSRSSGARSRDPLAPRNDDEYASLYRVFTKHIPMRVAGPDWQASPSAQVQALKLLSFSLR